MIKKLCLVMLLVGGFIGFTNDESIGAPEDAPQDLGGTGLSNFERMGSSDWVDDVENVLRPRIVIGLEEEYNDNIYLSPSDEEHDYITRAHLLLEWGKTSPVWTATLSYEPQYLYYSRHEEESEFIQTGVLRGRLTVIRDLAFLEASDTYSRVSLSSRRNREEISPFVGQTDRNVLVIHPFIRRRLTPTLLFEGGYDYTNTQYIESEGVDSQSHGANATLSKTVSPRLTLSALYRYRNELPEGEENDDYTRHEGGAGLHYRLGESVNVSVEGGVAWMDFSGDAGMETSGFWNGSVAYRYLAPFTLSYGYRQSYENSVESGVYNGRRHDVTLSYEKRLRVNIALFKTRDAYQEISRRDISKGIRMGIEYPVLRSVILHTGGSWMQSDYDPENERVIGRTLNAGLDWRLTSSFTVAGGYRYAADNSDVDSNDFVNHIAYVRLDMNL